MNEGGLLFASIAKDGDQTACSQESRCTSIPLGQPATALKKASGKGVPLRPDRVNTATPPTRTPFPPNSGEVAAIQIVTIQIHHLVPGSCEVLYKRLLRVVTCVDFGNGSKLRI